MGSCHPGKLRSLVPFHLGMSAMNPQMRQWMNGPEESASTARPPSITQREVTINVGVVEKIYIFYYYDSGHFEMGYGMGSQ